MFDRILLREIGVVIRGAWGDGKQPSTRGGLDSSNSRPVPPPSLAAPRAQISVLWCTTHVSRQLHNAFCLKYSYILDNIMHKYYFLMFEKTQTRHPELLKMLIPLRSGKNAFLRMAYPLSYLRRKGWFVPVCRAERNMNEELNLSLF